MHAYYNGVGPSVWKQLLLLCLLTCTVMSIAPDALPSGPTYTLTVCSPASAAVEDMSHVIWDAETAVTAHAAGPTVTVVDCARGQ